MKYFLVANHGRCLINLLKVLLLFFYLFSSSVFGNEENTYKITNIKINLADEDSNFARELAREKAIQLAFSRLLKWILSQEDYKNIFFIDKRVQELEIKNFVSGYQIYNENYNNKGYSADFTVMFDKQLLKQWLVKNKINFSEKKLSSILIIPILEINNKKILWDDPNLWRQLWQNESKGKHFIPIIFPNGDAEDLINLSYADVSLLKIDKLTNFASRYGMSYILVTSSKISTHNQDHYRGIFGATIITENKEENFFKDRTLKSYPGEILDDFLLRAINIISNEFDDYWLKNNKQNAKKIYFKVFYNDLSEWRFIVDTIKNLNEVGEVKILSLSLNEASLEAYISYRKKSDLHRLLRNYRIDIQSNSENENLYDVKIINAQDDNDKIINEDKTQSGENSDILVIE